MLGYIKKILGFKKQHNNKVIFLGAGSSKDAGYPLTSGLYDLLKNDHENSQFVMEKNGWTKFNETLETIKNNHQEFSNCRDIEYLMTLLSLLFKLYEKESEFHTFDEVKDDVYRDKAMKASSRANIYDGAKNGLARCIDQSLATIHDNLKNDSYNYLLKFFEKELSNGGTIITTNYDLLAERCLHDFNAWSASDGYGFKVKFKDENFRLNSRSINNELKAYSEKISRVKILKLHGSVGWLSNGDDIILDASRYNGLMPMGYQDVKYRPNFHSNKHLILPDFLKSYQNKTMLHIWAQAQQSIQDAEEVHVIGFSLPEYDTNIKTLLLPLINKILGNKCMVQVYILRSDKDAEQRWKNFLGNAVSIVSINTFKEFGEVL